MAKSTAVALPVYGYWRLSHPSIAIMSVNLDSAPPPQTIITRWHSGRMTEGGQRQIEEERSQLHGIDYMTKRNEVASELLKAACTVNSQLLNHIKEIGERFEGLTKNLLQ